MNLGKANLTEAGISDVVANFVFGKDRNNKVLNSEGLELGNTITLTGIASDVSESEIEGALRQWVDVLCEGDRSTVSIARLVSTDKKSYFTDESRKEETTADGEKCLELADDFDMNKRFVLPRREADALLDIQQNHIGTTLKLTGIARGCGKSKDRTYLLWQTV